MSARAMNDERSRYAESIDFQQGGFVSNDKPLPLKYSASAARDLFPSLAPASAHTGVGRSLSIRTTNISAHESAAVLSTRSAGTTVTPSRSGDGDPFDLPPTYSALDVARSPLRLRGVNGDASIGGE